MKLSITWQDVEALRRFDNALKALDDKQMRKVANRAINRTGDRAKTKVIRALTKQTGLKRKTIVKAVNIRRSTWGTLEYSMTARGGDVALKYFDARETRRGVSARPFGKRRVFPHTFMRGGLFPGRSSLSMGGHVFMPDVGASTWGRAFAKQRSGVVIPQQMVSGESAKAFEKTVASELPKRIEHELNRLTGGIFN